MRIPRDIRALIAMAALAAAVAWTPPIGARGAGSPLVPEQTPVPRPVPPPQGAPQVPRGSGLILGQVVDAATGRAVAGASVDFNARSIALNGAPARGATPALPARGGPLQGGPAQGQPAGNAQSLSQRIVTDADGRFVFHDLPKGTYSFSASAPGYLGAGYGQRSPGGSSRPFDLDEGQRVGDLKLTIWKYATMSGSVVDEAGDPVVGVQVRALRRVMTGGKPRLSGGPSVSTDDRGVYRIFNLSPGDYVIGIVSTQTTLPASSVDEYREAMQQGRGGPMSSTLSRDLSASGAPFPSGTGFRVGGSILLEPGSNGRQAMTPAPGDSGNIAIYQPLFYSSASVSAQATPIRLSSGEERSGLDLQMRLVRALKVSGTVNGPDGPLPNLGVHLIPAGDDVVADNSLEAATTSTDATGAFTFLGVPAGQYTLSILKIPRPVPAAPMVVSVVGSRLGGAPPPPPPPPPALPTEPVLWAQMPVAVTDGDVNGLAVAVRTGLRVSGQLQFDGSLPRPTADVLQRATITLSPADGRNSGQSPMPGRAGGTGQFSTQGYPPGKYFVAASLPAPGWSFRTAMLGGRDLSETPLELDSGDVSGIIILFTDRQTSLTGTVRDPKSPTNVDASVLVFPADYQLWFDNGMSGRRFRSTRTSKSGDFTIGSMPPGDYLMVALSDEPGREVQDLRFFAAVAGIATHISLGDGEKKTQELTVTKTPNIGGLAPVASPAPPPQPVARQSAQTPALAAVPADLDPSADRPHGPFVPFDEDERAPQNQTPARDNLGVPLIGTGTLTGTVVTDDASSRPIRRALVSLSVNDPRGPRLAVTDDAGHFVFTGLPAGRFNLSVSKPAYVGLSYGQKKPGQAGTPIQLAEAQRLDVSMRMSRGAALTGTVIGPTGQPAQNVQIQLMQYRMVSGERQLQMSGSNGNNSTDDRGIFRLYGLAPGEYILAASSRSFQADARVTTANDVQWAQQALRMPAGAPGSASTASALPPAPPPGPTMGYSSVFYPGTIDPAGATPITVNAGEERTGVDFPLQLVPTARIEGTVVGPDGQLVPNVQLNLYPKSFPSTVRMPFIPGISRNQDGRFTVTGVAPGEYTITARTTNPANTTVTINGVVQPPPPPPQTPFQVMWAMTDVSVNGADVADVVVSLQRGMTLAGRLVFEGKTLQPPSDLSRARVSLAGMQSAAGLTTSVPPAQVDANGAFILDSITPGKYRLSGSVPIAGNGRGGPAVPPASGPPGRGAPLPAGAPVQSPGQGIQNFQNFQTLGWSIKSAIVNGVDALDFPIEIHPNENLSGAVLTFTDQQTEISGSLTDRAGKPVPEFSIIVFSADKAFWTPTSRRIRQSRPSAEGVFRVVGLPPGEYFICAVADFESGQVNDPAFLAPLVGGSFKLTLAEGEKKTQDLRLAGGTDGK